MTTQVMDRPLSDEVASNPEVLLKTSHADMWHFLRVTVLLKKLAQLDRQQRAKKIERHAKDIGAVSALAESLGLGSFPSFKDQEASIAFFRKVLEEEKLALFMLFRHCNSEYCNLRLICDSRGQADGLQRASEFMLRVHETLSGRAHPASS